MLAYLPLCLIDRQRTMQQEQSSPHQHGSLTPGVLFTAFIEDEDVLEAEREDVVETVEVVLGAGIVIVVGGV